MYRILFLLKSIDEVIFLKSVIWNILNFLVRRNLKSIRSLRKLVNGNWKEKINWKVEKVN